MPTCVWQFSICLRERKIIHMRHLAQIRILCHILRRPLQFLLKSHSEGGMDEWRGGEKASVMGSFSSYFLSHEDKLQVTREQPSSHLLIYSFARVRACLEADRCNFKFFSATPHFPGVTLENSPCEAQFS